MDVAEAILGRRSIRDFTADPIPQATMLKILEMATHAPNSGNYQPWQIYVAAGDTLDRIRAARIRRVHDSVLVKPDIDVSHWANDPPEMVERANQMYAGRWQMRGWDRATGEANRGTNQLRSANAYGAPVVVVLCMPKVLNPFTLFDIGLLAQTIALAALHHGLESLIAAGLANQPDIYRQELSIPDHLSVVIGIAIGRADPKSMENKYCSPRRPIEEVVSVRGL